MNSPGQNIGRLFQQGTKYVRPSYGRAPRPKAPVAREHSYREVISLPRPSLEENLPFWEIIRKRRSCREYTDEPVTVQELSTLLWATQGVTEEAYSPSYRTVPSAGALHPIDTYVAVNRAGGLTTGVYLFHVGDFSLERKKDGNYSIPLARACLEQDMVRAAPLVFLWVAVIERSRRKYRERAYRYIYLDCGHIAQNLYLAATAMGLGCCAVAAFFDEEVNEIVGADGEEETVIYLAAVGRKRRKE